MLFPILPLILSSISLQSEVRTFDVGSLKRTAVVFAPTQKTEHPPLVFGFHGHGGSGRQAARSFRIQQLWPEAVVVYMDGLPTITGNDPKGQRPGWQNAEGLYQNRDLKFFDTVYSSLMKEFSADKHAVFAMGHSNGGRFTQLLWEQRGDKFAAFAPSGSHASRLKLTPKPVFHIMGENDPIVSPELQKQTIERLKEMNGCSEKAIRISKDANLFSGKDGNDVIAFIHPGGHEYPREAPALLVKFFQKVATTK